MTSPPSESLQTISGVEISMFSWTALPVRVDVQPETKMIIRSRKGDFFIKSIKIGLYK